MEPRRGRHPRDEDGARCRFPCISGRLIQSRFGRREGRKGSFPAHFSRLPAFQRVSSSQRVRQPDKHGIVDLVWRGSVGRARFISVKDTEGRRRAEGGREEGGRTRIILKEAASIPARLRLQRGFRHAHHLKEHLRHLLHLLKRITSLSLVPLFSPTPPILRREAHPLSDYQSGTLFLDARCSKDPIKEAVHKTYWWLLQAFP